MAIERTQLNVELSLDRSLYQTRVDWPLYEVPIDIDSAVVILTLLSHQFIDHQDEQDQNEFEKELIEKYKIAMTERFDKIEPIDE